IECSVSFCANLFISWEINSNHHHRSTCCLLPSSRCSPDPWTLSDAATQYASNQIASPRPTAHRQSDRPIRKTHDTELSCKGCTSCRKLRNACRVPFDDCRHRALP